MAVLEAIIAGAAGGVAVKGVEYLLARVIRGEIRQETRQSEIRKMIEDLIADTRRVADACGALEFLRQVSPTDVPTSRDEYLQKLEDSMTESHQWRPHRITDPELRQLAEDLYATRSRLLGLVAIQGTAEWLNAFRESEEESRHLIEATDNRMDALNL